MDNISVNISDNKIDIDVDDQVDLNLNEKEINNNVLLSSKNNIIMILKKFQI